MTPQKILILRFSSIGDIVLTTPVIRAIKSKYPDAEVHYCTKVQYGSLVQTNPYLDKVFLLEGNLHALISELRKERYDFVVDLHNNLRTRIVKARLRIPSGVFPKLNWQKWLYTNFKINQMPNVHVVDRYMMAAKKLKVKEDALGLDYFIPEADEVPKEWLPEGFQQGYVAVAIGGQRTTKKLPYDRLVELCDRINNPIVLIGGKEDMEMGRRIASFFERPQDDAGFDEGLIELGKKTIVHNACGKFNLNQSASLIKGARHVFTHDTGMMHIAAAFKKNIFSIWGNTTPLFGMYPYRTKFTVFENNQITCRPCSKIGHDKCPKGHFKCMQEVKFDFYLP